MKSLVVWPTLAQRPKKLGATVGSDAQYGYVKEARITTDNDGRTVSVVEFDVALSHASGTNTKGGIGVFLGSVALGSQGASHGESSSNSRIKFAVPVVFPGAGNDQPASGPRMISRGQY